MSVQSRPLVDGGRGSHVVTADEMSRMEPGLYRLIAVLLWLFSFAGNVLMFGNGWDAMHLDRVLLIAIGYSAGYQAICSIIQFITCKHWTNPIYLLALAASFVPSFLGYRSVLAIPLASWASGVPGDTIQHLQTIPADAMLWTLGMYVLYVVGLIAADVIPERVFVRH